jgi:hypothetical protein
VEEGKRGRPPFICKAAHSRLTFRVKPGPGRGNSHWTRAGDMCVLRSTHGGHVPRVSSPMASSSSPPASPGRSSKRASARLPPSPLNPDVFLPDVSSGQAGPGQSLSPNLPGAADGRRKSSARDLLRKHYGLGLGAGPPARLPPGKDKADPMDLGGCAPKTCSPFSSKLISALFGAPSCRFDRVRRPRVLRAAHHDLVSPCFTQA